MRRAYSDFDWLEENGEVLGINLGYDFCAEHEYGVSELQGAFDVPAADKVPEGLDDRKVTALPPAGTLVFHKFVKTVKGKREKRALLIFAPYLAYSPDSLKHLLNGSELHMLPPDNPKNDLVCAWSSRDFAIMVRGKENIASLKKLHDAFQRLDIVFGSPSAAFLKRSGLTLAIRSKISEDYAEEVLRQDKAVIRLYKAAEDSGIEQDLKKAGKRWYALKPKWADAEETELTFFLNPAEQGKYNHGWFNLEQLRQWAEDTGPVLKSA